MNEENKILDKTDIRRIFKNILSIYEIKLSMYQTKERYVSNDLIEKLNQALFFANNQGIEISTLLCYIGGKIGNEIRDYEKITCLLNKRNLKVLKNEMSSKYRIKIKRNTLMNIMKVK